jgi:hypothetical protein
MTVIHSQQNIKLIENSYTASEWASGQDVFYDMLTVTLQTFSEINLPLYMWRDYWYLPIKNHSVHYIINTLFSEMEDFL